jgi:ABC-type amino acid transport substrate-binding protein
MRRADIFVALLLVLGAGYMAKKYDAGPASEILAPPSPSPALLRIGVEGDFPPFNEKRPDGRLEGLDIDIAEALCARLQRKCVFIVRSWDQIFEGLAAKKYDAIVSSLRASTAPGQSIVFTEPYYRTPGRFAVRKDSTIAKADERNLRGVHVAVTGGTLHQRFLEVRFSEAIIIPLGDNEPVHNALARGEYEAVFGDSMALYQWLKTPEGACCRLLNPGFSEERFFGPGIAVALRASDRELHKDTNLALKKLREDGTLSSIIGRYFPFPLL